MADNPQTTPKFTAAEFGYALKKACRTQVPEKWEGEKDAWMAGYIAATEENLNLAMEFLNAKRK